MNFKKYSTVTIENYIKSSVILHIMYLNLWRINDKLYKK